jgi:hypothetical protein
MAANQEDHLEAYKARFGLTYQVDSLRLIDGVHSLAGKRVLEIGGSNLPRPLVFEGVKASQWICVDDLTAYGINDVRDENHLLQDHYSSVKVFRDTDDMNLVTNEKYAIIDGNSADLSISDYFDVAISIAAFEHIHRFPEMLSRVYDALRFGGHLLSLFQPIWSCINGHHVVGVKDAQGREIDFSSSLIPPWGHLIYTPPQLYRILCERTDRKCAADIVYQIFNSTQVNRLFFEDYVEYVEHTEFRAKSIAPLGQIQIPEPIAQLLSLSHPGRKCFDANAVFIHAVK